ncbi:Potassium/sodium hyperpolarization-activated cyclic nucleotide-gated channel 2 (Brain cyclic nucleotide-gated channel 2) (BCNG-2) [Durusdinium trenchii]|uniref:Potassium/sodium hyperpolarization-activated cyclic nucleotide-gated channel 2 (Brain cyclic nucleotide-gated channel 2) (BCNG-2) n=1 Tax=Durusdinium trenchii TaxID=1381693 RepID=A0ABP0RGX6_9DINO
MPELGQILSSFLPKQILLIWLWSPFSSAQNLVHYLSRPWYLRLRVVLPDEQIQRQVEKAERFWKVPIFIICRDRLVYLQMLVSQLHSLGYYHLIALDNNSTYKPLLNYYQEKLLWVVRLPSNLGNEISHLLWRMRWNQNTHMKEYIDRFGGRYVLADPDTVFDDGVPANWLQHFWEIMDRHQANKVGAALRLDDLPENYAARKQVWQHECDFWREDRLAPGEKHVFWAPIDTTMALTKISKSRLAMLKPSANVRVAGPYTVRHLPWYENSKWLLPDVEYARKHRGKGHTFGWWSHAEGYARRGKQIIDSESQSGQFKRASNQTFAFPPRVKYLGFCRRFSAEQLDERSGGGTPHAPINVRPAQCHYSYLPERESHLARGPANVAVRWARAAAGPEEDFWRTRFAHDSAAIYTAVASLLAAKPAVVLDVGAGEGASALWLARALGGGLPHVRVVALESEPVVFERLCRNIAANGPDVHVVALRAALGDDEHAPAAAVRHGQRGGEVVSISSLRMQAIELEEVSLVKINLDRSLPTSLPLSSSLLRFLQQTRSHLWLSLTPHGGAFPAAFPRAAVRQLLRRCAHLYGAGRGTSVANLTGRRWRLPEDGGPLSNVLCTQAPLPEAVEKLKASWTATENPENPEENVEDNEGHGSGDESPSSPRHFQLWSTYTKAQNFAMCLKEEEESEDLMTTQDTDEFAKELEQERLLLAKAKTPWWVLSPNSPKRICWDLTGVLILLYDLIMIPMYTAFPLAPNVFLSLMTGVTLGFWTLDILACFCVGYYARDGTLVVSLRKIAKQYLFTWFPLDVIIVSIDWIIVLALISEEEGKSAGLMRAGKMLRALRVLRTLRLLRLAKLRQLLCPPGPGGFRAHFRALGHCQTLDSHLFHQPLHRLRLVFGWVQPAFTVELLACGGVWTPRL